MQNNQTPDQYGVKLTPDKLSTFKDVVAHAEQVSLRSGKVLLGFIKNYPLRTNIKTEQK